MEDVGWFYFYSALSDDTRSLAFICTAFRFRFAMILIASGSQPIWQNNELHIKDTLVVYNLLLLFVYSFHTHTGMPIYLFRWWHGSTLFRQYANDNGWQPNVNIGQWWLHSIGKSLPNRIRGKCAFKPTL